MKNRLVKSTIILVIGGFITKIMAMIIKIILTRNITTAGVGIYMLILPTFNLFINLATMGLPISISKLVSENKKNNKKLVLSIIPIMMLYNILLILIIIIMAPIISNNLLHNKDTYYPLIAISLSLPFISLSSIIRGYFFGKERMFPHTLSNVLEQIIRLLLIIIITPKLMTYGLSITVTGIILTNIISESIAVITMLIFLPRNLNIKKEDIKYDKNILKDVLSISIPTTSTRLIGSLGYFLEPIILTFSLKYIGYSDSFIVTEYGVINGYIFPLILLPSFFTMAISQALLPIVSNNYVRNNIKPIKRKLKQAISYSLFIGVPVTIIIMLIPDFLLNFIYNTNEGINYLKIIAPFFILHYIQSPLTTTLQGMGKAKEAMEGTIIGTIVRIVLLFVLSLLHIGMWSLIISSIVNILIVTVHHIIIVRKYI